MTESLVAINIICNDKLINKNGTPLLFYWDGQQDIYDAFKSSNEFIDYLYHTVMTKDNYINSYFAFFKYYLDEEGVENYQENKCIIQDFITFQNMREDRRSFYKEYLSDLFLYLYKSAYHEDYNQDISIIGIDESILDIYDKIQEKYPKKVIKSTVINYIRSELLQSNKLSIPNTDWIIDQLEDLLSERE